MDVYSRSHLGIIGLNRHKSPPTGVPFQHDEQCWGIPKQGDAQIRQNYDLNSIRKIQGFTGKSSPMKNIQVFR